MSWRQSVSFKQVWPIKSYEEEFAQLVALLSSQLR